MVEKKYPMTWSKCPVCGSKGRVVGDVKDELIDQGKWREGVEGVMSQLQVPMVDPGSPPQLKIPVLIIWLDACSNPDCGALYCVRVDRQEAIPQLYDPSKQRGPGPGMGPQMPPFFGKG